MADTQHEMIEVPRAEIAQARSQSDAVLALIERAARDDSVDMDKMERLLEMQERIQAKNAEADYSAALAAMQPNLPAITKRGTSNNGKYAKWEHIQTGIMPRLAEYGFSLQFKTDTSGGEVKVTAILRHTAGHKDETTFTLKPDGSGNKQAVHAVASAVSYAKRYAASALLNIQAVDEDDDGNAAARPETIDDAQLEYLRDLLKGAGRDEAKFLAWMKVESLEQITVKGFEGATKMLRKAINKPETSEA